MLPTLISVGPVKLYSSGFFLFLGLFLGLFWWWRLGRDEHLDESALFDTWFMMIFWFFVISRVGYVLANSAELDSWSKIFGLLAYSGLLYWLGIVASSLYLVFSSRAREWKVWRVLDIYAVALSVVMLVGSIGAFLNGTNPGREMGRLGMMYPGTETTVFPVDLLNIVWYLLTFILVSRVRKNFRFYGWYKGDNNVAEDGLTILSFMGMTGGYYVLRSLVDDNLIKIGNVSVMLIIGILLVIAMGAMIYRKSGMLLRDNIEMMFTPREARFKSASLRRKARLLKLKRNKRKGRHI